MAPLHVLTYFKTYDFYNLMIHETEINSLYKIYKNNKYIFTYNWCLSSMVIFSNISFIKLDFGKFEFSSVLVLCDLEKDVTVKFLVKQSFGILKRMLL